MTFEQRLQSIEELIRSMSSEDPNLRDRVDRLLRAVIDRLGRDPLVSSLLVLHGLHPLDLETRVREAVAAFAGVEVLSVQDGRVRLRAQSANRAAVEAAVYGAAPDIAGLEIESAGFVP